MSSNKTSTVPSEDAAQSLVEQAKAKWIADTANSPAQQSGAWSTPEGKDQLWQQHQMNQDFQQAKKSGTLDEFAAKYPHSQTAKERAIRNKIPTSLEMEF